MRRSRGWAQTDADAQRSVSGVEQRDICGSKCGFAALLMGSYWRRGRRGRFRVQSSWVDEQERSVVYGLRV